MPRLDRHVIALLACVAACSGRRTATSADGVAIPLASPSASQGLPAPRLEEPGAPWTLTASDGTGLELTRVDAKAVFTGPLAFTELHLYFHNSEDRVREGTFQITLPARAAVSRFAMEHAGHWMEGEVVDKALARRAYDDFLHRGQDPALLEKAAGNQFTARVFPIPPNADKHLVISFSQTLAGEQYRLPLRGLPTTERLDIELAITGVDGQTTTQRLSKRNWRADRDFVSSVATTAAGVVAGSLVVAQIELGDRAAPSQPPSGITLLVDTSASRGPGYEAYLGSIGRLVGELRAKWGDDLPLQIVAFDQTTQQVFAGRAADFGDQPMQALARRGAAGASDLGQALSWLTHGGEPQPRVVIVTDGVITAGVDGAELASRVTQLALADVDRVDVVLSGALRDEPTAALLVSARLSHPGAVFDLEADPVAVALADPVAVDVAIEVADSTWSYPRSIASARPGMTALVYARLAGPSHPVDITVGGRTTRIAALSTSSPLLERAVAHAEVEELEADLLRADATRAPEVRAALARKSVKSRVLSSQTSMLVLETEADYERYQIDRNELACTLVIGRAGFECSRRASAVLLADKDDVVPPAPVITVTSGEITYQGELVATSESVLRDDSPTFAVDALREQLEGTKAGARRSAVLRIDETTDVRLVDKVVNTAKAAGVELQVSTHGRDELRNLAAAQLETLQRQQTHLQRELAFGRGDAAEGRASSASDQAVPDNLAAIDNAIAAKDIQRALVVAREWHARAPDDVLALIGLGNALEAAHDDAAAARTYGSIIDLFPGRAELRRLAGERLERVANRHVAARTLIVDTYRRAVADRPDHLTGHRLLAYALLRDGEPADAFAAILAGIDRTYRGDSYRGGMRVLADDAGMLATAYAARFPALRLKIEAELAIRSLKFATKPSTRFILYWETDTNDVDFHIRDKHGEHAYYQHMQLASGGELYADVTTGYGPECFTIAGTANARPYRLGLHYYSRGPMGYGMGMLEIQRFDGKGALLFEHRPFVVVNDNAHVELGRF